MPRPPRQRPAPPESRISSKRSTPGREFGLDDLDRRDPGIALVDRDAGCAILGGARPGAAGDDLVLHVVAAGMRVASAEQMERLPLPSARVLSTATWLKAAKIASISA